MNDDIFAHGAWGQHLTIARTASRYLRLTFHVEHRDRIAHDVDRMRLARTL